MTTACRSRALTAAGYTVVRFTWRQLRRDPQNVADRLRALGYRSASASRNSASSESSIE